MAICLMKKWRWEMLKVALKPLPKTATKEVTFSVRLEPEYSTKVTR
jgi:hypothetical protein